MIVEQIDRSGHVLAVHSFQDRVIDVGRGYRNDLTLQDPHIDERHARITCDPEAGTFQVQDLGALNATRIVQRKHRTRPCDGSSVVPAGTVIQLGRTRLRLVTERQSVPAAVPLSRLEPFYHTLGSWWFTLLIALVFIGVYTYLEYLGNPHRDNLYSESLVAVFILFVALLYAGIWSLVARTQNQEGRLLMQISAAILALLGFWVLILVEPYIAYNLPWLAVGGWFSALLAAALLFALLSFSGRQATRMSWSKTCLIAALPGVLIVTTLAVGQINRPDFSARPEFDMVLVPPAWQWRKTTSEADFLLLTRELYQPAD